MCFSYCLTGVLFLRSAFFFQHSNFYVILKQILERVLPSYITHTQRGGDGGGAVRAWADPHYPFIRPLLTIAAGHVISTSSKGSKGSKAAKAAGAAATAAIFNPSH